MIELVAGQFIFTMARIIGIDYGRKRTGLAVTDPLQIICSPLETIPTFQIWDYLSTYISANEVSGVVVGLPKKLNNQPSEIVKDVHIFAKKIQKLFPSVSVDFCDERFTSSMAQQAMVLGRMKKSDRQDKANIDRISASLILQTFIEQKRKL